MPYQELLVAPDRRGVEIDEALAFAPESGWAAFSYVTEHVDHDLAAGSTTTVRPNSPCALWTVTAQASSSMGARGSSCHSLMWYRPGLDVDGMTLSPTFEVMTELGDTAYWEHLGDRNGLAQIAAWKRRLAWYEGGSIRRFEPGTQSAGALVVTWSVPRSDPSEWEKLARAVLTSERVPVVRQDRQPNRISSGRRWVTASA